MLNNDLRSSAQDAMWARWQRMVGSAVPLDFTGQAAQLRQRAEAFRLAAGATTSPEAHRAFLLIASDYDKLADSMRKLERRKMAR